MINTLDQVANTSIRESWQTKIHLTNKPTYQVTILLFTYHQPSCIECLERTMGGGGSQFVLSEAGRAWGHPSMPDCCSKPPSHCGLTRNTAGTFFCVWFYLSERAPQYHVLRLYLIGNIYPHNTHRISATPTQWTLRAIPACPIPQGARLKAAQSHTPFARKKATIIIIR